MTNNLALQLYAAGLGVFPCRADKAPAVPKGADWRELARLQPDIHRWSSGVIGLPVPPGTVILDLDTYKGVTREQVDTALGCRLPWDSALIQHTQNGGQHYAFAVDWPVLQDSDLLGVTGFDTRVAGKGYICAGDGYTPAGFGLFGLMHPENLPQLPEVCRAALEHRPAEPSTPAVLPEGNKDVNTIRQALAHLNPGCSRGEWLRVGLALRHQFHDDGSTGMAVFDEWSRGALTATGEPPENYSAETMQHQWSSFKPEGGITIATLFYSAIGAGWAPPAGIDTSAAFGGTAASSGQFDTLIDRITELGGNPKSTNDLIAAVQALACNELQRGILLATLHRELKDAGLLTKEVRKQLEGKRPARPQGEYGKNHTENAAAFIDTHYPEGTICRSQEVWYVYNNRSWEVLDEGHVKHLVAIAMAPSMPQHSTVTGTYNMMSELVAVPGRNIGDMPPGLVLTQNGVLDLNSGALLPHNKDYFTTNILPYNYNIQARSDEWQRFLESIFEGDQERIALLQEWFGYLLSGSYDYQKVMLLLGPRRCGKGTIGKVLQLLVGDQNFSGGALRSFTSDKFIDSLRTKTVMFIGDAEKRMPRNTVDHIIERIKSISGNDAVSFDRIYKRSLTERLPTRITVAANNVPGLFDDSGALASRLLVLPFNVSFYNREDPLLYSRLAQDIEGIAIWALQGLARLNQNGRFTVPEASQAETDYISEAYSPLRMFLDAACIMGGDGYVPAIDVYNSYKAWAILNQEDNILPRRTFISSFKDLVRGTPCIYGTHRTAEGTIRGFKGLTLRQLGEGGSIPLTAVK